MVLKKNSNNKSSFFIKLNRGIWLGVQSDSQRNKTSESHENN